MIRTIIITCVLLLSGAAHGGKSVIPNDPINLPVAPWIAAAAVREAFWEINCIARWPTLLAKQEACMTDTRRIHELELIIKRKGQP